MPVKRKNLGFNLLSMHWEYSYMPYFESYYNVCMLSSLISKA